MPKRVQPGEAGGERRGHGCSDLAMDGYGHSVTR
jgi:hypothetical protein